MGFLPKAKGEELMSMMYKPLSESICAEVTRYATLFPSTERSGFLAPEKVEAERLGTDGKSLALVAVTSSLCTFSFFCQVMKPSLLMETSYCPGSKLMVSSVAVVSLPLM